MPWAMARSGSASADQHAGIEVGWGNQRSNGNTISGNKAYHQAGSGIDVEDGNNNKITGNVVHDNRSASRSYAGLAT